MTKDEIDMLISAGVPAGSPDKVELVETHISWVLLCNQFVFKIKKPLTYSFLDFSTIEKRKYFCEREVQLNSRLTKDIYLDVLPVVSVSDKIFITDKVDATGAIIDYAVRMKRIDKSRQMDMLLLHNEVGEGEITRLAEKIALFHKSAKIIYKKDILLMQQEFNDLEGEKRNIAESLSAEAAEIITRAITSSDLFLEDHQWL